MTNLDLPRQHTPVLRRLEQSLGVPLWSLPLFVIAGTLLVARAYPRVFFSSGFFQLAFLPLLFILRMLERRTKSIRIQPAEAVEYVGLFFLATIVTVSFLLSDQNDINFNMWIFGYLVLPAMYFLVRRPVMDESLLRKIAAVYVIFGVMPFIQGVVTFYQSFGIPSAAELFFARYNFRRIAPYQLVTYGSTGATAAVLTLILPLCIFYLSYGRPGKAMRWFLYFAIAILMANVAFIQVRALMAVLLAVAAMMIFRHRPLVGVLASAATIFLASALLAIPGPVSLALRRFVDALMLSSADGSVSERLESLRTGTEQLRTYWQFGIGPGQSIYDNPIGAAHEFLVNQGAETGAFGIFLWALLFLIWMARFLYIYMIERDDGWRVILLVGPFCYQVYAIVANADVARGPINPWIGSMIFLLALGASAPRRVQSSRGNNTQGEVAQA